MIFQCGDLERALGSAELMPDLRAHAEHCPSCSRQLYLWSEISRLAPSLHQEWESPELWPRIRAGLAATARPPRRAPVWRWAVAAALVAMAVALSQPWQRRQTSAEFLTDEALREVQQAESAYSRSIGKLSAIAEPGLQQSPAPLAAAYREKLALLDSAIADLQANIAGNRYNTYLQMQLASLYREKQKTLEDWLENAKHD